MWYAHQPPSFLAFAQVGLAASADADAEGIAAPTQMSACGANLQMQAQGRVVNVTSTAGFLAGPQVTIVAASRLPL
jgi:hypothetical protein